nr:reverse transcriptase domain-containing protein [Tanacetum cinerariifolium]
MRTRSNFYPSNSPANIPRRSNRRRIPNIVEPEIRTIAEIVPMADRTMKELLQAPTEGYGEAIVISEILAENFKIKTNLLQLVQANKFHGRENDNPHTHISYFKKMTAILKYRDVPNDANKLMLFSYSLEDRARIWYEKEPPNSILTWDDLVNKFFNQFFPLSKTTHLKNKISRFTQRFEETFSESWERFKDFLRECPHHGFLELTQIDTFYNGLIKQDQDSLNAASGGNILNKTTREALKIIENKSKVRYSRSKSNASRVNTNSRDVVSKTDDRIDKLADQISNLVEIVNKQVIAPPKAVKKTYVTCRGAHAYYECIATDSNPSSVCVATGSYNQVSSPNRASHQIPPPGFAPNNQGYRAQMNNAPNFQNHGFQNQPFSIPNNQIPPSVPNELSSYIKSNKIAIKSMQNKINVLRGDFNKQEENLRRNLKDDMRSNSDDESECDVPDKDDSSPAFTTFSNPLFDYNDDFTSSYDDSLPDEDVPTENFKVYSNPLFDDEEINSDKLDPHYFNAESDLIESLLNRYTLIDSSAKLDFLLKEFSGELTHINSIIPEIKEADFDLEEEIRFVENLLYDNSSPRPLEELNAEIDDTIVESLSPSTIPVEDSDSLMDEIDLFLATDELLPPNIKSDGYDSEGDIHFLEELLVDSIFLPENESFYFDYQEDPSFSVFLLNHRMLSFYLIWSPK